MLQNKMLILLKILEKSGCLWCFTNYPIKIHAKCFQTWIVLHTGTGGMEQNFIIVCQYFLKTHRLYQSTSTNQNFLFCCWYFSCFYYFHMSLPYLSGDGFLLCLGSQGCCWGLNPKIIRGLSHFLVWCGVTRNCTNISLPQFLCEWQQD